jgi:RNA polymerase sigma factor (sigma-70 family)
MSVPTVDADQRPAYRNAYEHLAPLFAQYAALPQGDPRRERLRTELIAGYLPVAQNIARRYSRRGEPSQDVEQVASVGLVLAVDRFDPGREVDFLSFAIPTINGEVLRHFRDRVHTIRPPRRLRELQSRIHDAAAAGGVRSGGRVVGGSGGAVRQGAAGPGARAGAAAGGAAPGGGEAVVGGARAVRDIAGATVRAAV